MPLGTIVSAPNAYTHYATVRDENGQEYTVHGTELASEAKEGDQFAYRVSSFEYDNHDVTTLRGGVYGPEAKSNSGGRK